ncbi:MAG: aspartate aminotransferase family protein [Solirubrobacterales bacterium]
MAVNHDHLLLHFAANGAYTSGGKQLLVLERAEGSYVYDTDGRRYLDGLSSLFCCQIGYRYGDEMAEVAGDQLRRLPFNTNWATAHPPAIELSSRLAGLAPEGIEAVFFTNGGSESVEAAWKIVLQYHAENGEPERRKAIARDRAYHGITMGALALTGVPRFREPFGEPAISTRHVSSTNPFRSELTDRQLTASLLDELQEVIDEEGPDTIAMVIAEPIQNAGGCLVPPPGYWEGLREICDRFGILLVADEVISGFGRIGEWFGGEVYGGRPDLITVAKGLTSGYAPMGAVLVHERIAEPLYQPGTTLLHGITFGGHPLSAAIALHNIEIFEREKVLDNVRRLGPYLRRRLEEEVLPLPIVGDIRGHGFFFAAEMVKDDSNGRFESEEVARIVREIVPRRLLEVGLIARADDRGDPVLQVAPPLIADEAVLDELVTKMRHVLAATGEEIGMSPVVAAHA